MEGGTMLKWFWKRREVAEVAAILSLLYLFIWAFRELMEASTAYGELVSEMALRDIVEEAKKEEEGA